VNLSAASGVSVAHLSRIEKGLRQPSLEVLLRLARAHSVSLGQLLGTGAPGAPELSRAADRPPLSKGGGADLRLLSGALPDLTCVQYDVAQGWSTEAVQHVGAEWVYVLACSVTVEIADHPEKMTTGDAIHFDAWAPHRLTTPDGPASILLVTAGAGTEPALSKGAPPTPTDPHRAP
jgi:hypothetical protein